MSTAIDGNDPLRLAIAKGSLFEPTLDLLQGMGLDLTAVRGDSRSLIFDLGEIQLITMRPSDVPTYIEAGAADVGVTGKDVLVEQDDRRLYELLDLGFGRCRMALAAPVQGASLEDVVLRLGLMRIATKYPRTAIRHFEKSGRQVEIVEVKGSVEIAPLTGLADAIVDLVDTGRTLAENGLEIKEEISESTARLVANQVSRVLRAQQIDDLCEKLAASIR
jgi:ATP phosphoribosyltransferase